MNEDKKYLSKNEEHFEVTHSRWIYKGNRNLLRSSDKYLKQWGDEQCGGCRYYIVLTDLFVSDWGVCSHPQSAFDGRVMFEHDGCDYFDAASDGWYGDAEDGDAEVNQ